MLRSMLRGGLTRRPPVAPALALAALTALASCGDGAGPGSTTALSIKLTDAPGDIQHAFVTITEIHLIGEDGRPCAARRAVHGLVDFDVEQSFGHQAGQAGDWVMHPVVTGGEIEATEDVGALQ